MVVPVVALFEQSKPRMRNAFDKRKTFKKTGGKRIFSAKKGIIHKCFIQMHDNWSFFRSLVVLNFEPKHVRSVWTGLSLLFSTSLLHHAGSFSTRTQVNSYLSQVVLKLVKIFFNKYNWPIRHERIYNKYEYDTTTFSFLNIHENISTN